MSFDLVNVSYAYDAGTSFEKPALTGLSFSLEQGSFVGIAGASGSGKTTLVRLLKGLIKPSSGEIKGLEPSKVGLVFQYPELQLFEATVLKDVMFGPLNLGFEAQQASSMAEKALALMGLDSSFYDRDPLFLSGGEQRRVAIAGILAMDPEVLILDEPTAGLDAKMQKQLFSVLKTLNDQGKTIILVSHNMDDLTSYCQRVIILKEGRLLASGTPVEVFSNPEVSFLPSIVQIATKLGIYGVCTLENLYDILKSNLD